MKTGVVRVVLEPRLEFGERGELVVGPRAAFHNIPEQPILTQATRLITQYNNNNIFDTLTLQAWMYKKL